MNTALHEFARWEEFPITPARRYTRRDDHPAIKAINRYAESVLEIIIAGAPVFYVVLFLAYLAVSFGIIG